MDVDIGEYLKIRFYAKIQSAHIETVMIHHLLKYTKCGLDDFLIVLLSLKDGCESIEHGVITKEASFCKVPSTWFTESDERLFRRESFLFTFFIALGRFGNLPNNHDNWGITNLERKMRKRSSQVQSNLMIIDFSSDRNGTDRTFNSYDRFTAALGRNIYFMFRVSLPPYSLYYSENINELARSVGWLHSRQTMLTLLQRVCTATDKWFAEVTALCSDSTPPTYPSSYPKDTSLSPFRNIPKPNLDMSQRGHFVVKSLINEYASWVYMWNRQLVRLFEWFPFPYDPPRVVSEPEPVLAPAPAVAVVNVAPKATANVAAPTEEVSNTDVTAPLPETSACTAKNNDMCVTVYTTLGAGNS